MPKLIKPIVSDNPESDPVKKLAKGDMLTAEDMKCLVRPIKRKRKEEALGSNLADNMSDMVLDDLGSVTQSVNGTKRTNGRTKSDETDTNAPSSISSKERISTRTYNKTSRGAPDRSTAVQEKPPSIEDAVYIYRALMNNGTRPPIFLQRSLVYLQKNKKRRTNTNSNPEEFQKLLDRLDSLASVCSKVQLTLTNVLNVKLSSTDRKEITIDFYVQKNCYKRRKTDITTKERFVKCISLITPLDLDNMTSGITIDTSEISSDIGSHHMSACYLKAKVSIATERKTVPITAKKAKKKYYPEVPQPRYRIKEYVATLLLYSGGKSYLPSGKQTLFLHEVNSGEQMAPQYMDWNDLSATPQLVLESVQLNHRRSARSTSPIKHHALTNHKLNHPASANHGTVENASSNHVADHPNGDRSDSSSTPYGDGTLTTVKPGMEKLYFVLQYKGAPQTTVQIGYTCPFCLKKTRPANVVYLLKHLRLCHSRLLFLYKETEGEPAIIVTVNSYYDGSYCGNPLDIVPTLRHTHPLCDSFKRVEPTRRTPYTEVLNIRADRRPLALDEFSRPEPLPLISSGSSLLGHNRQYYHSISNQPVLSNDFDNDSDAEDTEWSRIASSRLIDEFIDVNKGEKELMKLWNNFISRNTEYISDVQMEEACLRFVTEHSEIVSYKLRNNFLCHLATLYDSSVLQAKHVKTIIEALPKKSNASLKGKALLNGHHPAHRSKVDQSK